MLITSRNNPLVKARAKLEKSRTRKEEGLFIVGGKRELEKALDSPTVFNEFFFCDSLMTRSEKILLETRIKPEEFTVYEVSDNVMDKLSPRKNSHGLIGIAEISRPDFSKTASDIISKKEAPLFAVLEKAEKPGNIGAVLRTCDGLGVDMLILCDPVCDIYNPNVIRSSLGCYFSVPWAICTSDEAVSFFKENKISTFASTPRAEPNIWDLDYSCPAALIMGSEKDGLTDFWLEKADYRMKIPMAGAADSLNLAQFSTLAIYEAVRQRNTR